MVQKIDIDFSQVDSYKSLIFLFERLHTLNKEDTAKLVLNFSKPHLFVHSDHLMAVVAIVHYFRTKEVPIEIEVKGESNYASRVNFFRLLGVHYEEPFVRRGNVGRFIELSKFTNETTYGLQDHLTMILHQLKPISIEVKQLMFYCLGEIMDNVLVHSGENYGWVCAQLYPKRREIRLMICDHGIGVLQALHANTKAGYQHINEAEALELCIQRGVTNGKGLGFGLYASSKFIELNSGEMLLYSGINLSMRIDGAFFRREIETAIERGEKVELDFEGVEVVSNSFADECFAKLMFEFDLPQIKTYTTFVNASPFIKAVIANSFKERLQQATHA